MFFIVLQLWTSLMSPSDPANGVKLFGSWQSCAQDGVYGERVYDRVERGVHLWSLHMGPKDEFALYRGYGPEGEDHEHNVDNLLGTAFRVSDIDTWRGKRNWTVPSLKLHVNVVAAGGSRDECNSFVIKIEGMK